MLGVFLQCHTGHVYGHTRHAGFSWKKNEPSCDIILLRIKACIPNTMIVINLFELPQPHSETFGLT